MIECLAYFLEKRRQGKPLLTFMSLNVISGTSDKYKNALRGRGGGWGGGVAEKSSNIFRTEMNGVCSMWALLGPIGKVLRMRPLMSKMYQNVSKERNKTGSLCLSEWRQKQILLKLGESVTSTSPLARYSLKEAIKQFRADFLLYDVLPYGVYFITKTDRWPVQRR